MLIFIENYIYLLYIYLLKFRVSDLHNVFTNTFIDLILMLELSHKTIFFFCNKTNTSFVLMKNVLTFFALKLSNKVLRINFNIVRGAYFLCTAKK